MVQFTANTCIRQHGKHAPVHADVKRFKFYYSCNVFTFLTFFRRFKNVNISHEKQFQKMVTLEALANIRCLFVVKPNAH